MIRAPKPGILSALPLESGVPVLVVRHLDPRHRTVLADLLDRRSAPPGCGAVKAAGGVIIVAAPATAECPSMPEAAIRTGPVELVAVSRCGRSIICSVACSPFDNPTKGVVMLMESVGRD